MLPGEDYVRGRIYPRGSTLCKLFWKLLKYSREGGYVSWAVTRNTCSFVLLSAEAATIQEINLAGSRFMGCRDGVILTERCECLLIYTQEMYSNP